MVPDWYKNHITIKLETLIYLFIYKCWHNLLWLVYNNKNYITDSFFYKNDRVILK